MRLGVPGDATGAIAEKDIAMTERIEAVLQEISFTVVLVLVLISRHQHLNQKTHVRKKAEDVVR